VNFEQLGEVKDFNIRAYNLCFSSIQLPSIDFLYVKKNLFRRFKNGFVVVKFFLQNFDISWLGLEKIKFL
jgi:hypothetical protein